MKCPHRAVLIITRAIQGTASNVAKTRIELTCEEPQGHAGEHVDTRRGERWLDQGKLVTTLVRHDDEED